MYEILLNNGRVFCDLIYIKPSRTDMFHILDHITGD